MTTIPSPAANPSAAPDSPDSTLAAIVSAAPAASIADVLARMRAIDSLLADGDGLKWFNRLYLMVTEQVDSNPPGGAWQDPEWLLHLDVVFAGLYFNAIRDYLAGATTPSAFGVVFEWR